MANTTADENTNNEMALAPQAPIGFGSGSPDASATSSATDSPNSPQSRGNTYPTPDSPQATPVAVAAAADPDEEDERVYHQDYIARIRYENTLPPPPGAPKLLEIPHDALAHFTSPAFATRLAREQPPNIEPDSELGMPIDLVGMPGIFDGDESSIQAPLNPPPVHPRDRALLRPLSTLGKPTSMTSGVSFLRRTEYISSEQGRSRFESTTSKNLVKSTGKKNRNRRKKKDAAKEDPVHILRHVQKGFDIANPKDVYKGDDDAHNIRGAVPTPAEIDAWNNPVHPTNPNLRLVESYPIVPDLDAFPDSGGYMTLKFNTNPGETGPKYDDRLDVALLRPLELSADAIATMQAQQAAHEANPNHPPPPPPAYDYEFFLPEKDQSVENIKRKFDVKDPKKDDPELYTSVDPETGDRSFRYGRVRTYETAALTGSVEQKYDEVVLALNDGNGKDGKEKGAYYYPILTKSQIRPRRTGAFTQLGLAAGSKDETDRVDFVNLQIREPNAEEAARRKEHREEVDGTATAKAGDATVIPEGEHQQPVEGQTNGGEDSTAV